MKGGPASTYATAKYDLLDRVTDIYLTNSHTLPNELPSDAGDIRIGYDGTSDLATDIWRGTDKHVTYSYDMFGRIKTYKPTSGPIPGVNLAYNYNRLGQKTEVKVLDGNGQTVHDTSYDYYPTGALKAINFDGGKVAQYAYNSVGLPTQIDRFANGVATGAYDVYTYDNSDPRDLLKTIAIHYKDASGQPTASILDYTDIHGHPNVDKAGNLLGKTDLVGHWTYTYDHGGRVVSITPPNPVPDQGIGGVYGYNWLGQLLNPPAEPNRIQYNAAGLPILWPGMYSYTYKANGLPEKIQNPAGTLDIATITYDAAGFPTGFSGGGKASECQWDADGGFVGYADVAGGSQELATLADPTSEVQSVLMDSVPGDQLSYVCDPLGCVLSGVSDGGQQDYHSDRAGYIQLATQSSGQCYGLYARSDDGDVAWVAISPTAAGAKLGGLDFCAMQVGLPAPYWDLQSGALDDGWAAWFDGRSYDYWADKNAYEIGQWEGFVYDLGKAGVNYVLPIDQLLNHVRFPRRGVPKVKHLAKLFNYVTRIRLGYKGTPGPVAWRGLIKPALGSLITLYNAYSLGQSVYADLVDHPYVARQLIGFTPGRNDYDYVLEKAKFDEAHRRASDPCSHDR